MCRWLAYSGSPILMKDVLYRGTNSLVDQSLHSRLGAEPTNGDGFGVGWYGAPDTPGRLPQHRTGVERPEPARAGRPHQLAAVLHPHPRGDRQRRAADQLPPVPPRQLAVHAQRLHQRVRARSSATSSSPSTRRCTRRSRARPTPRCCSTSRSPSAWRTTPRPRSRRRSGSSKRSPSRHGVPHPFQGTVATTDGESIWAFRYSSERQSRSLFYTTDVPTLRKLYPDREELREFSDDARLIVSEPLGDVAGVWNEVPESTWCIVGPDHEELQPFQPKAPSRSVPGRLNARPA